MALPVDRACNVLYALYLRNTDEKERSKRIRDLTKPPPGKVTADPRFDERAMAASWGAAFASDGG